MGICASLWLVKGNVHASLSHLLHDHGATHHDIMAEGLWPLQVGTLPLHNTDVSSCRSSTSKLMTG